MVQFKHDFRHKHCQTCDEDFDEHNGESCPYCGSGDWEYKWIIVKEGDVNGREQ